MSSLPEEIHAEVLSRLPVSSIFRFKSVCKNWNRLISSPKFVKDHLSHAKKNPVRNTRIMMRVINDDTIDLPNERVDKIYHKFYSIDYASISSATSCKRDGAVLMDTPPKTVTNYFTDNVGSCNGLILLDACKALFLWNPSTGEYKKIEVPRVKNEQSSYGFGYSDQIDNYKLVCLANGEDEDFSEVHVYTLGPSGGGSWRRGQNIPYVGFDETPALLLNGALHWLSDVVHEPGDTASTHEQNNIGIISFDINSEKFTYFPFPKQATTHPEEFYELQVLGGYLCLVRSVRNVCVDVWVMQTYGVTESWTKKFTTTQICINSPRSSKFYHLVEDDEILIHYNNCFSLYNQKSDRVRFVHINGTDDCPFSTESYVESLVPLNSGTYTEKKITDEVTPKFKKRKLTR